jgi:hypothetical protein
MHFTYLFGTYALTARIMAVTFPRLTIVDAAWTTTDGPINLIWVENTNMLAASTDPVAASWYTAKFMLTPIARYPFATDPDLPGSTYKNTLENWTTFLADSAGFPCTKDSAEISVYDRGVLTSLEDKNTAPRTGHFQLFQNYPNPFNPVTTIRYTLPKSEFVTLKIYDILGREVAVLVNERQTAGSYSIRFDANQLSSGLYFYKITAGDPSTGSPKEHHRHKQAWQGFSKTRKMVVMK